MRLVVNHFSFKLIIIQPLISLLLPLWPLIPFASLSNTATLSLLPHITSTDDNGQQPDDQEGIINRKCHATNGALLSINKRMTDVVALESYTQSIQHIATIIHFNITYIASPNAAEEWRGRHLKYCNLCSK